MPFKIIKNKDKTYKVINAQTKKVHAYNTTKIKAENQVKLLTSIQR